MANRSSLIKTFLKKVILPLPWTSLHFYTSLINQVCQNSPGKMVEMSHLKAMNSLKQMSWKIECVTPGCHVGVGRNESVAQSSPIRHSRDSFTAVQVTGTRLFCQNYTFPSSEAKAEKKFLSVNKFQMHQPLDLICISGASKKLVIWQDIGVLSGSLTPTGFPLSRKYASQHNGLLPDFLVCCSGSFRTCKRNTTSTR